MERRNKDVVPVDENYETPFKAMAEGIFGIGTRSNTIPVTVTTVNKTIVPLNPNRVGLLVVNHSDSVLFIGFRNDTSITSGIRIAPLGGAISMIIKEDGHAVTEPMFGAILTGSGQVSVIEVIMEK